MLKIVIDPGHGGNDPGAVNGQLYEKHYNLVIAAETARYLNHNYSAAIHLTRIADTTMGLGQRADYANELKADYFVSIHVNAGGGTGFESFIYTSTGPATPIFRNTLHNWVADFYKSHGIRDRGKKTANFTVLGQTVMPAVLLENLFIDNEQDLLFLKNTAFLKQVGTAIGEGIARALKLSPQKEGHSFTPARLPATGLPDLARKLLKTKNPAAPDYINTYITMGELYRIRWDAVFAQSCKETAYWKFGGDVKPEQNNFAGLGTFGGDPGASFATPVQGIEAQFQHWHVYYHGGNLPQGRPHLNPRRNAVISAGWSGTLNSVENLGGRWAPGQDYGVSIVRDYLAHFIDPSTSVPDPTPNPPDSNTGWNPVAEIERLKSDGLIYNNHAPGNAVTWGEFAAVLNRLRDRLAQNPQQPLPPADNNQPAPGGQELLQNGDFSQSILGWVGSAANILTEANGNKYAANSYTWRVYQDFTISPGWQLLFTGRTRKGANPTAGRAVIGFITHTGVLKVGADIRHTHVGSGWEQFPSQKITVPPDAASGRIFLLTNGGSGTHFFDDISIKRI